jgi:DNA-binding Lrp family transcriptional regulator
LQILFSNSVKIIRMIKKLLTGIFSKKPAPLQNKYVVAQLNDKIMPIDRADVYEDPLDEFLKVKYYGEVSGGGTLQAENGEIKYCDVEIKLVDTLSKQAVEDIITKLEKLGAPKGSKLIIEETGEQVLFGKLEGMAVYLDGVNLSDEVYENLDVEELAGKIKLLIGINSDTPIRHWQGNTETALYFYHNSFEKMKEAITELMATDPGCENARITKIA